MSRAALALLFAVACGRGPEGPERTPPGTEVAAGEGAPGLEGAPSEELFVRIARGERSFGELWDPERGIVYVAFFEDASGQDRGAGEDGLVRLARRLCGPRASELVARLEEQLRARGREIGALDIECADSSCTQAALGEFDFDTVYGFERSGGPWILARVFHLEGGPVTEEFRQEARAFAASEARRLAGTRCR